MKALEKGITILGIIFFMWLVISWFNIMAHNNPSEADGDPASWNAFVLLTEVAQ